MGFRFFTLILIFFCTNLFSEIIYDKEIIITNNDLKIFKDIYKNEYGSIISDQYAIKLYALNIKKINQISQNNFFIRDEIDKIIELKFKKQNLKSEPVRAFVFFNEIQNQLISEYFKESFDYSSFIELSKNFKNLKVGLSLNQCLTIERVIDINENTNFLNRIYDFIKDRNIRIKTVISENSYEICISEDATKYIEILIYEYIKEQTKNDLIKYLHS